MERRREGKRESEKEMVIWRGEMDRPFLKVVHCKSDRAVMCGLSGSQC